MNLRMQRFHSAAHDLGESGVLGDFFDRNAVAHQEFGSAARGQQFDAALFQFTREFDDPCLIGNAEQRAANGREQCLIYSLIPNSLSFLRKVPRLMPRIVAARL